MKINLQKERVANAKVISDVLGIKIHTITPNPPCPPLGYLDEADPFITREETFGSLCGHFRLHLVAAWSEEEAVMVEELDTIVEKVLTSTVLENYIENISAYYPIYTQEQQTFFETQIGLSIPLTDQGEK